jgi:hypothetical protein
VNRQNHPSRVAARSFEKSFRGLLLVALGALAIGSAGCYARVGTGAAVVYDEPVVAVDTVPVYIESYPRYTYNGSVVYLVDGRWYHRDRGRWVAYRVEPRALASVRVSYESKYGRHYRPTPRPENASPRPRVHRHHHHH